MKRLIALLLVCSLVFVGCATKEDTTNKSSITSEIVINNANSAGITEELKDVVYEDLVSKTNGDDFYIENIEAIYISQEYIEELEYDS